MADPVREYVRAAQQAELRGEVTAAVDLLVRAAVEYRDSGRVARALSMLRHARRLAPSRPELDEEIRRLEAEPVPAPAPLDSAPLSLDAEMQRILGTSAPADPESLPGDTSRPLVERGPQPADPRLDAWCSFCCRPKSEIGSLVAGPAGAFVCAACTGQIGSMFALDAPALASAAAPSPARSVRPMPTAFELPAQAAARHALAQNLGWGRTRLLLVGPEGSGKTVLLRRIADAGEARVFELDAGAAAEEAELLESLRSHPGPVIVAVRGERPTSSIAVETEEGARAEVFGTAALRAASGGRLGPAVLDGIEGVIALDAPDAAALEGMASALLSERGHPGSAIARLAQALAREAVSSGRGAHELVALVRRVPRGVRQVESEER